MIHAWRYDDGEPIYMEAISSWTERQRPCWRCQVLSIYNGAEMENWFKGNVLSGDYDFVMRFNSGNPYIDIKIYEEKDAVAFLLRWS
jgi:hypothetical protein